MSRTVESGLETKLSYSDSHVDTRRGGLDPVRHPLKVVKEYLPPVLISCVICVFILHHNLPLGQGGRRKVTENEDFMMMEREPFTYLY